MNQLHLKRHLYFKYSVFLLMLHIVICTSAKHELHDELALLFFAFTATAAAGRHHAAVQNHHGALWLARLGALMCEPGHYSRVWLIYPLFLTQ